MPMHACDSESTHDIEDIVQVIESHSDYIDEESYRRLLSTVLQSYGTHREPRPSQMTIESEIPSDDDDVEQLINFPRDVNIERTLNVGGDTNIQGNLTVQGNATGSVPLENILEVTTGTPQNDQQFTSVKAAVNAIGTQFPPASPNNQYIIRVGPGVFQEDPFTIPAFVGVQGEDRERTILQSNDPNTDFISMEGESSMQRVTVDGATGPGSAGVCPITPVIANVNELRFLNNNIHMKIENGVFPARAVSATNITLDSGSQFERAFVVDGDGARTGRAIFFLSSLAWATNSPRNFDTLFDLNGAKTFTAIQGSSVGGISQPLSGDGFRITDGARARITSSVMSGFQTTFDIPNIGMGPNLTISGSLIQMSDQFAFNIENPNTEANISGTYDIDKISINPNASVAVLALDNNEGRTVQIGSRRAGDSVMEVTNISEQTNYAPPIGGIPQNLAQTDYLNPNTPSNGIVQVPAGNGYVAENTTGKMKFVEWSQANLGPFGPDVEVSIGIDNDGNPTTGISDGDNQILLGSVVTDSNQRIVIVKQIPQLMSHNATKIDRTLRRALANVVDSGAIVTENSSNPGQLDVTQGRYIFGSDIYQPSGGSNVQWGAYFQDSNNDLALKDEDITKNTVPDEYNIPGDPNPLQPIPGGEFARHTFYVVGEGAYEQYLLQYGQTTYSTLNGAVNGTIPPQPDEFSGNVALIASIVVNDTGGIEQVIDERGRSVGEASRVTSVSNHGNLTGLGDDDHTQYLRVDGGRAMTGDLDMGNNDINNVEKVNVVPTSSGQGITIGSTSGNALSINSSNAMTVKGDNGSLNINNGNFTVNGSNGNTTIGGSLTMGNGNDIDLSGGSLDNVNLLRLNDAGTIETSKADGDSYTLDAYDTNDSSYTSFITLTAGDSPTADLSTAVTQGGNTIYRANGQTVAVSDGGTGLSTTPSNGQLLIGNGTGYTLSQLAGGDNISITNASGSITIDADGALADTYGTDGNDAAPSNGTINISGGTSITTSGSNNTVTINADGDLANTFKADTDSAAPSGNSITFAGGSNISSTGNNGSTITYDLDSSLTGMNSINFNNAGAIETSTSANDSYTLDAYDTSTNSYTSFITLTAGDPPTADLSTAVTQGGKKIYRVDGQNVAVSDGGTGLSSTPSNGQLLIGNGTGYTLSQLAGGDNISISNASGSITIDADGALADTYGTDGSDAAPSNGTINISGGTSITTSGSNNTVTINADGDLANTFDADTDSAAPSNNSITFAGGSNISSIGNNGSTITYDLDSSLTGMNSITFNTGGAINNINNIDADTNNTINFRSNSNTNILTVDAGKPSIDVQGTTITDAGTINTNDNRNLVLDPGGSHNLQFNNVTDPQEDNVLTIDASGNVGISSNSSSNIAGKSSVAATLSSDVQPVNTASNQVSYDNPDETYFVIPFDVASVDTASNFDTTNHTYTIPKDGIYFVTLQVGFNSQNAQKAVRVVRDSGSGSFSLAANGLIDRDVSAKSTITMIVSGVYKFNSGDILRAEVASDGTSIAIQDVASRFSVYKL